MTIGLNLLIPCFRFYHSVTGIWRRLHPIAREGTTPFDSINGPVCAFSGQYRHWEYWQQCGSCYRLQLRGIYSGEILCRQLHALFIDRGIHIAFCTWLARSGVCVVWHCSCNCWILFKTCLDQSQNWLFFVANMGCSRQTNFTNSAMIIHYCLMEVKAIIVAENAQ